MKRLFVRHKWVRRMRTQMLVFLVGTSALLVLIMMFFLLRMADTHVSSLGYTIYRSNLLQAASSLNLQIDYYKRIVDLFVSYNIRVCLNNIYRDPDTYYINQTRIKREILNYSNKFMFDNIFIFPREGGPINAFFNEPVFEVSPQVERLVETFMRASPTNGSVYAVSREDPFRIAVFRPIYYNTTYVGVVEFDLNMEFFFSVIHGLQTDGYTTLAILDENGKVIFTQSPQMPVGSDGTSPRRESVLSAALPASQWTLLGELPKTRIDALTSRFVHVFISMSILLLITFSAFSLLLFHSLQRPLKEIIAGMQKVQKGDFTVKLPASYAPLEYQTIIGAFNDMVSQIHDLLNTVYEQQKLLRISEVSDLQAKLNPHFLYNTLDMIHWELIKGGQEKMAEMVIALSEILRYSIRHKHEFGTVLEEMHQIENYLKLQSMRTGDSLEWSIELEDNLEELLIPRLLLQPLVENCIRHAFTPEQAYKFIGVSGRLHGEEIILVVVDNGVGIAPEKVQGLLERKTEDVGLGISLVNRRIQLIYGARYGVTIESLPKPGCMVTTTLLAHPPGGEE